MTYTPNLPPESIRADRSGVGFLLNQAARAVRARLAAELHVHGLDDADFILLRVVMFSREQARTQPATAEGVAAELNLPLAAVVDTAHKLGDRGWIGVSGAGTELSLSPTRKALSIVPGLVDTARWTLEESLNGFSREEIDQLSVLLQRIIKNVGATL